MALITPAQVAKLYPSLQGTGEDTRLTDVISWVDSLLAGYCGYPRPTTGGRTLQAATYQAFPPPSVRNASVLLLPIYPIASVTSIYVDPGLEYGASSLVDSTEYTAQLDTGEIVLSAASTVAWSEVDRANRVTYVAGFADAPSDLVAIAASAVRDLLDYGKAGAALSVSAGGQSVSRAEATSLLSPAVRGQLDASYVLWGSRAG